MPVIGSHQGFTVIDRRRRDQRIRHLHTVAQRILLDQKHRPRTDRLTHRHNTRPPVMQRLAKPLKLNPDDSTHTL